MHSQPRPTRPGFVQLTAADIHGASAQVRAESHMVTYKGKTRMQRFLSHKWSKLTREIHDLPVGSSLQCPADQWNTVHGTVNRFNDAYDGERRWKHTSRNCGVITVTREA